MFSKLQWVFSTAVFKLYAGSTHSEKPKTNQTLKMIVDFVNAELQRTHEAIVRREKFTKFTKYGLMISVLLDFRRKMIEPNLTCRLIET